MQKPMNEEARLDEKKRVRLTDSVSLAERLRLRALEMTTRARSSHIGSSLSSADIIAVLYGGVLRLRPDQPDWPGRDRFLLSKGHGCAVVYAALALVGFFPEAWLETYCLDGGKLPGHITHAGIPGVEASTGSLGHGLSMASGMALAGKLDRGSHRVFVLMSDGECDEGSTWEAALFAPQHGLDNLVAIVDYNKQQACGPTREILDLDPLAAKFSAFGWAVREVDGHDHREIEDVLMNVPLEPGKPSCIIAHTVKGKGVSFMEDQVLWHYRFANEAELAQAKRELRGLP
jgi:transketolase